MKKFIRVALGVVALCAGLALAFGPVEALASVTSQTDKTGPVTITGLPQVVPVGFPFQAGADLLVLDMGSTGSALRDPATVLVLGSDYTVSGGGYNAANQMQTGSITVLGGGGGRVLANDQIVVMRGVAINQINSYTTPGPNLAVLLEQALDKQATLAQQVNEVTSRSLQFENFEVGGANSLNSGANVLNLASRKSTLLGFDANGNPSFYPTSTTPLSGYPTLAGNNVFTGNNTFNGTTTFGGTLVAPVKIGTPAIADTGVQIQATASANGYVQEILQNTSNGAAASADYVVNNNLGTSTTYYGDFGINSSTFSGTGSLSLANATYLYSANGDLVLGTFTGNTIHLVVNNSATDSEVVTTAGVRFNAPIGVNAVPLASAAVNVGSSPTGSVALLGLALQDVFTPSLNYTTSYGLLLQDTTANSTYTSPQYNGLYINTPTVTGNALTGGYMLNVQAPATGMAGGIYSAGGVSVASTNGINVTASGNGLQEFVGQNTSTGTSSYASEWLLNSADSLRFGITSTAYSGSILTGGASGEVGFITTSGNQPLSIGVNTTEVGRFTSTGLNNTAIGASTPSTGAFTTLNTTSAAGGYTNTATPGTGATAFNSTTTGTAYNQITLNNTAGTAYFGIDNSTGGVFGTAYATYLASAGSYPMNFMVGGALHGSVTTTGFQGAIGATTPAAGSFTTLTSTKAAISGYASLAESAGAVTIDWSLANTFALTLNANLTTVTFSNAASGETIIVAITNTASNYTVTWGNGIKWSGGSQPTQTTGAHTDVWTFVNVGGTYYGSVVQNF